MTVVADMGLPRWQRILGHLLPWYDPAEQEAKVAKAEALAEQVGRIESVRIAYRKTGNRLSPAVERRKVPR